MLVFIQNRLSFLLYLNQWMVLCYEKIPKNFFYHTFFMDLYYWIAVLKLTI